MNRIQNAITLPLLAALAYLPLACGGNLSEEGYAALQEGNYGKAMKKFENALAETEIAPDARHDLEIAYCQALAHLDPDECVSHFTKLSSQTDSKLVERDFETVASELMQAKAYVPALTVIDQGIKAHADNERLPAFVEKLKSLAAKGDNPELTSAIDSMGYSGG